MRHRVAPCALALAAAAILISTPAVARAQEEAPEEVSAARLIEDGIAMDGRTVVVWGELVGDYGFRADGHVWAQLNQDSYSVEPLLEDGPLTGSNRGIAIRLPEELVAPLDGPGRYWRRGPVVEVTGVWRFHDPDRAGESYLDVEGLTVIEPARPLDESPNWFVYGLAVVLLVVAAGLWLLVRRDREG